MVSQLKVGNDKFLLSVNHNDCYQLYTLELKLTILVVSWPVKRGGGDYESIPKAQGLIR